MLKSSLRTHQRVVLTAAIAAALMLAVQPDPFTMLIAMALLIPVASLFIAASGLLLGRGGFLASTVVSCLVIVSVLIYPLMH